MLTSLPPQRARHEDGSIVQVADSYSVEYIEVGHSASVQVDFGTDVGIFADTLSEWRVGGKGVSVAISDRSRTVDRIAEGLRAMGSSVEIC